MLFDMNPNVIKAIKAIGSFVVFFALDVISIRVTERALFDKGLRDGMKEVNNSKSKGK